MQLAFQDAVEGGGSLINTCISYQEKEEVRVLLRKDPKLWIYRPLSELMVRAAADDVCFLLYIYHKMMKKLNEQSLWYLSVRGALYCRCLCVNDNDYTDWPPIPPIPDFNGNGIYIPSFGWPGMSFPGDIYLCRWLNSGGDAPEEEMLSILVVPRGKMGRVIGRKGVSILAIKKCCNAEIHFGGAKGPPDNIFVMGPAKGKNDGLNLRALLFGLSFRKTKTENCYENDL
ncbi:3'-5' exonuclease domain-containing protein [Hibiscus syriacus]|uniref:3'-5' exonuclease domain-containing protein n=1 Tax=Hibiscus syriacus TaxID=106335 RepID=A0A6A2YTE5_HIBSY|nr:3'-5' exonuclease domain-containing protein [Hibiscus syriacus]